MLVAVLLKSRGLTLALKKFTDNKVIL